MAGPRYFVTLLTFILLAAIRAPGMTTPPRVKIVSIALGGQQKAVQKSPTPSPAAEKKAKRSLLLTEFHRRAQEASSAEDISSSAQLYVAQLPLSDQVILARALIDDSDFRFSSFGISLLIDLGYEDEAAPRLARMVADGRDLLMFYWAWIHSDDKDLQTRMYVKISRNLLKYFDNLPEQERKRAELFFCQDGFGSPLRDCSRREVIERLKRIEAVLKKNAFSRRRPSNVISPIPYNR